MEIEARKPIWLVLSKSDLIEMMDDTVKLSDVKAKAKELNLKGCMEASSKVWEDFNVHKAFNKALTAAYEWKYVEEGEEDSDD